ncbi:MAG TPA: lamin tail domain-containing protein [Pyrinomonadaceae bacterium]|nr:lamin tail domain-containing protein [Pyrinomonadaceae bacterium]
MNLPKFLGRTHTVRRQLLSLAVAALIIAQPFLPLQSPVAAQKKSKGEMLTPSVANPTSTVFINEFHYDDSTAAGDTNEFVEVAGPAGTNLTGWSIVLYNGEGTPAGRSYSTTALPTSIPSEQGGYGTVAISYNTNGIQNGQPDGIALVNNGTLVQFLCYEGTFTASDGPANGQACTNIGVSETNSTAPGSSLHLTGTGTKYGDFTWSATTTNTKDAVNTGQTFTGGAPADTAPTVASTTPADNALNVPANTNISITFSEPVTATSSSFQINCNQSGAHAFTLSGGPTTYTLDPTTDFVSGEVCTVTVVAAQVTDQDGTPDQMAANYVFDFTILNTTPQPIFAIQGNGASSPFAGQIITTSGIVTLLRTSANTGNGAASGFFLQTPTANADSDPNTSEGIFVFTNSVPTVSVGDSVSVTGTVVEFNGLTEITNVTNVSVNSTGNSLPTAVTLTTADLPPTAAHTQPQLEKYEGMRMFASSLTTSAPNDEFYDVYAVITGVPRPLREPGIEISLPVPPDPTSGQVEPNIPRWDENPERISIDTNGRAGAPNNPYTSNVVFTNVAGPLDFAFGEYRLIPESGPSASANMNAVPVPTPTANEFTVASFNLENFNNDATQRQKAALAARDVMRLPDIIGMVEIFELADLQALATEINTISPGVNYQAYLVESDNSTSDDADQDVGYLVNANRVQVNSVQQIEKAGCTGVAATCNTFIDPTNGQPALLNDRPPLVLRANVQPSGANVPVIVIVNHMRSFINVGQDPGEGPRVRAKRKAQGEFLASLLQDLQTNNPGTSVISVGDYNAFQFSDGYTDPIATIKGVPTPDEQIVVDQSPDLVNPNYTNLVDELPATERYSFNFEGTLQALDHIIVNNVALSRRTRFTFARNNADFPDNPASAYRTNPARSERNSDHDMPVAYFSLSGPLTQSGAVLISEFRFNGPGGEQDEFIELYNNTNSPVDLSGWSILAPTGTGGGGGIGTLSGTIAPRQHYLVASNSYSASGYAAGVGTTATPDVGYTGNAFLSDGGARLIDLNGTVVDAVGFSSTNGTNFREGAGLLPTGGLTPGASDQYSFVRNMKTGVPQDTNDNALDFVLISTTGTVGATTAELGAPGPENMQSPIQSNAVIKASLIDNCSGIGLPNSGCQNRVRDGSAGASNSTNAQFGTLSFRRKFTNTTQQNVTRLRFRVVDITTLNSPGYAPNNGRADLRVLDSTATTVTPSNPFTPGDVEVSGTMLEQPPTQTLGGGLNSTLTLDLSQPLAGGDSIVVQLLVGVQQNGSYRFFVNVEADFEDPVVRTKAQGTSRSRPRR